MDEISKNLSHNNTSFFFLGSGLERVLEADKSQEKESYIASFSLFLETFYYIFESHSTPQNTNTEKMKVVSVDCTHDYEI